MKQLSCAQCRAHWNDLISETFAADSSESVEVQAHLATCADCRKEFDLLVAARRELQQLPAQKAPATLRAAIRNQIENQPKPAPWWQAWLDSFSVSPQRLAWAGSALFTVFLVALLMRPERQAAILQTAPKVLSNQEQIQQHNQPRTQPPIAPVTVSPKKGRQPHTTSKTHNTPVTVTEKDLPRHKTSTYYSAPSHPFQSNFVASTPIPKPHQGIRTPSTDKPVPAPAPLLQKPAQQETFSPAAGQPAPAASTNSDQATRLQGSVGQAAPAFTVNGSSGSVPMMRSMAADSAVQNRAFKARSAPEEIHWSKTVTSDQDAAHAEISLELESGLAFADADDTSPLKRTLWEGQLHRGQQIPLNATLVRTSNQAGKLHLIMTDMDTQKVLLDEEVTLPDEQ